MAAALQAKPFLAVSAKQTRAQRRAVCVYAQQKDAQQPGAALKLAAAGLAAAALLHGAPADAGVVLVQPEIKKVFVDDGSAKAPKEKAVAAPKEKKTPAASYQSEGGIDFKLLTLPASLVAIAGGAFALSKIDPGFLEMMEEAGAKDSRAYAGYETALKDTPFFGGSGSIPSGSKAAPKAKPAKAGTTKVAAGTTKKSAGGLGGLFKKN